MSVFTHKMTVYIGERDIVDSLGKESRPGHMFFSITDQAGHTDYYGFYSKGAKMNTDGEVRRMDSILFPNPSYQKEFYLTQYQYDVVTCSALDALNNGGLGIIMF
jgi:hypothetical protein